MRVAMLLLLWLVYPAMTWADEQRLQFLHEIRTRSHLLCASAMLYFNPATRTPDSRALASIHDSLNLLATRTVQLEQPVVMVEILRGMQHLVKTLERIPRQESAHYPQLLMQLLQLHRRADGWASEQRLQQGGAGNASARALRQQSLEMARLLLDYQARAFPLPEGGYQGLGVAQLQMLDRDINARFEQLAGLHVGMAEGLAGARKNYRFVRAQSLTESPLRSSGGVEFYLARSVVDLDELAARESVSPGE